MLEISLHTFIYALHLALILLTSGILLVIFSLQNHDFTVASTRLFKLFFIFSIIAWILFAVKDIYGQKYELVPPGSGYIISGFLLLIAVKQYPLGSKKLWAVTTFSCIVLLLNTLYHQLLQHFITISIYALIIYPMIFLASFRRALELKNIGNGLIAVGALLIVVSTPTQLYIDYTTGSLLAAYSIAFVTTTSSYVLVSIGFLTSLLIHEHRQLLTQALNDPLTGVLNRRGLSDALKTLLPIIEAKQKPLNVIVVDIDHFKRINDKHGHRAGDQVLTEIAGKLKRFTRASDLVARIGGEEFVILLPELDTTDVHMIANRIRQEIADAPVILPNRQVKVTASFGITFASGRIDFDTLLNNADRLMYQAKHEGRNCICFDKKLFESPVT